MDLLVKLRQQCHISSTNRYFFASTSQSNSHLNAWQVIHRYAINAGCEKPDNISTTRIRKYSATVLQVLALKDGELEWLANHLGHSVNIHREVYRLHENTIEVAKVSKVLLAMESGQVNHIKGKSLEEIDVDDIKFEDDEVEVEEDVGSDDDPEETTNPENEVSDVVQSTLTIFAINFKHTEPNDNDSDSDLEPTRRKRRKISEVTKQDEKEKSKMGIWGKQGYTDTFPYVYRSKINIYCVYRTKVNAARESHRTCCQRTFHQNDSTDSDQDP